MNNDLIIGIYACGIDPKYRHEINVINSTWGKSCEKLGVRYLFFMGEEETDYKDDKYIYLKGVKNDYLSATYKHWHGYKYIYDNFPDTKFILMIGSDTFVDVQKLLNECFSKYDYNDEIIIGGITNEGHIRTIEDKQMIFIDGGSGYVITKATHKKLCYLYENKFEEWFKIAPKYYDCTDVCMSYYCIKNNIKFIENPKFDSRWKKSYNIYDYITMHPNDYYQLNELSTLYAMNN
jgi:hypothetical protein